MPVLTQTNHRKSSNRRNNHGNTCVLHTRQDLMEIIKFCNHLADRIDELEAEINQLRTESKNGQEN